MEVRRYGGSEVRRFGGRAVVEEGSSGGRVGMEERLGGHVCMEAQRSGVLDVVQVWKRRGLKSCKHGGTEFWSSGMRVDMGGREVWGSGGCVGMET